MRHGTEAATRGFVLFLKNSLYSRVFESLFNKVTGLQDFLKRRSNTGAFLRMFEIFRNA